MGHPTWVYHDTEEAKVVDSDDCEALAKDGWRDSPGNTDKIVTPPEDGLDELRATAMDLGIKWVSSRWTREKLESSIAAKRLEG